MSQLLSRRSMYPRWLPLSSTLSKQLSTTSHEPRRWSPSDLMLFMQSPFACHMARLYKEHPRHEWFQRYGGPDEDLMLEMLSKKGQEAERKFLKQRFTGEGSVVSLSFKDGVEGTAAAIHKGVDVIYQAPLSSGHFRGVADFLVKLPSSDSLTAHYEIWDAKLAKHPKPQYGVQLCCYSEMLASIPGVTCSTKACLVLDGASRVVPLHLSSYDAYYRNVKKRFLAFQNNFDPSRPPPLPTGGSPVGRWDSLLKGLLRDQDDISLVAGVGRREAERLKQVDLTARSLGGLKESDVHEIAKFIEMDSSNLNQLVRQAKLQSISNSSLSPQWEFIEGSKSAERLRATLHPYCQGDMYFDLEGSPFSTNQRGAMTSREYLWGVSVQDKIVSGGTFGGDVTSTEHGSYIAWWGHDDVAEQAAFVGFMHWLQQRLSQYPNLHVYHYGAYEMSALKRLAGRFGQCEDILDNCLRLGTFVDVYTAVKRNLLVGEPRYSIKNVEKLWRSAARGGDGGVAKGDDSIVAYQQWLDLDGDPSSAVLESIRKYNQEDCDSTLEGVLWLRSTALKHCPQLQPSPLVRETIAKSEGQSEVVASEDLSAVILEADHLDVNAKELMSAAINYEKRELKPMWWRRFDWLQASDLELESDTEAMMLTLVADTDENYAIPFKQSPRKKKLCFVYSFSENQALTTVAMRASAAMDGNSAGADYSSLLGIVSEEDCLAGDWVRDKPLRVSIVSTDMTRRLVTVEMNPGTPPRCISVIPDEYVNPEPIPRAVSEMASQWISTSSKECEQNPIYNLFARKLPQFDFSSHSVEAYEDVLTRAARSLEIKEAAMHQCLDGKMILDSVVCAAAKLKPASYLPIQGPPGTGKSTSGALIVADAVSRGLRVAVTANSHKVITNMLAKTAHIIDQSETSCGIVKVGGSYREDSELIGHRARGVIGASSIKLSENELLIGATAWALAHNNLTSSVDLLIVDEAGQVPVARLPAMGRCLKPGGRLIVLGDQMQLPAPVQGTHPGFGDRSILEYILSEEGETSVIKPNQGIFLPLSFRLHPSICDFISAQVYSGQLHSHPTNANRVLDLKPCSESRLITVKYGVTVVPVEHSYNTITSEEEVKKVLELVKELCDPSLTLLRQGNDSRAMTLQDILIVSPFNLQVKKLAAALGPGSRVGTVDKFQGQEAPVVILSLARSSLEEVGSNSIDFLLDIRRLNVALSRAQVCAIAVMSPKLGEATPSNMHQMKALSFSCKLLEQPSPHK